MIDAARDALVAVGGHPHVALTVTRVEPSAGALRLWIALTYARENPVCCGEPGCYVPFLGVKRREVPRALAAALALGSDEPAVSMAVALRHPEGYRYSSGIPAQAVDCTLEYDAAHFA